MTKEQLFNKLREKGIFWSYTKDITLDQAGDKLFLEYLLKYGDFDDLVSVFKLYDRTFIKEIWEERLKSDQRFVKLNLLLARLFFKMEVESNYFMEAKSVRFEKFRILASQN